MADRKPLVQISGGLQELPAADRIPTPPSSLTQGGAAIGDTLIWNGSAWAPAAGGGLTGFTATLNVASPNSSSNVSSLQASGGTATQDFSIMPKGSGSILAQIPDNGTGGGNKRGGNSVDLQRTRSSATQVAGGTSTFIGAGQDNQINGSLSYSSILNGGQNLVSASFSTVVGGELGEATGAYSFVGGGAYGKATGQYSFVGGGRINTASGDSSFIPGGRDAITRGVAGAFTHAAGRIENVGDAQTSVIVHSAITSNATLTNLTDKIVSGYMAMPDNSAFAFEATVVAKYDAIDFSAWTIKGLIKRGAGVATTAFVGTPTVSVIGATAGASAWAVSALASTGIGALILQVTGESGKSIKWVGRIVTVEVA